MVACCNPAGDSLLKDQAPGCLLPVISSSWGFVC